jgi:hypothetical protein
MTYKWDVFISYRGTSNVTGWVRNHLHPVLRNCLEDELVRTPSVFVDNRMDVGTYWPDELAQALSRSRYLLAVWSPQYFTSHWCVAEWQSMLARERVLGIPNSSETVGLVYPVVYSDGASFPSEAGAVQCRFDFSQYGYPYEQFGKSEAYLDFHAKVQTMAVDLAKRIESAPTWQPDWPMLRPDPYPEPLPHFPRLGAA